MKCLALLACLVLLGCGRAPVQREPVISRAVVRRATPEDLGASLLRCLVQEDRRSFISLFATVEDLHSYARKLGIPAEAVARETQKLQRVLDEVPSYYDNGIRTASELGIDWGSVRLVDVTAKINRNDHGDAKMSWMDIRFSAEGVQYLIKMDDGFRFDDGWKFTDHMKKNIHRVSDAGEPRG